MSTQATLPPETPAEAKSGGGVVLQRLVRARIVTEYLKPPIPTTAFDWIAYREGQEDGHRGFGQTEAEAITELLESEV